MFPLYYSVWRITSLTALPGYIAAKIARAARQAALECVAAKVTAAAEATPAGALFPCSATTAPPRLRLTLI